jgi:sulfatase maturation enzyme AslB (radical SAM superfamily)
MLKLSDYTDLEIDITSKCNLNCPLCYRFDNIPDNNNDMPLNDYKRSINMLPNLERVYLGFLLSEPTMHKDFIEIVKWTKSKGLAITLSSNGNVGAKSMWKHLAELLDSNDKIIWPVDGSTQEIYAKYRSGGKLNKVIENQQYVVSLNPLINHVTQFIQFEHNAHDDVEKIKAMTPGTTFQQISCCGDCGSPAKNIRPVWDIEEWIRIKREVYSGKYQSSTVNCMTKQEKIIFVTSEGYIGFCPSFLADYLKTDNKVGINHSDEIIEKHINDSFNKRFENSVCQFNCGQMALKLKDLKNLGAVSL